MNILIACEESQRVCKAFRDRGHNAYSCDILAPSGEKPEWHIQNDVSPLLNGNCEFTTMDGMKHEVTGRWDMIIAFPPCTYLTTAGAVRLYRIDADGKHIINQDRYYKGLQARKFFMSIYNADCDKIVIENPTPMHVFNLPPPSQIIQPYYFGEPYQKRTLLWLKGVNELKPTDIIEPYHGSWVSSASKAKRKNKTSFAGVTNPRERSKTFLGVARAMAEQWG